MPLRLGLLGMWHVHATGIVRQIAAHPEEFELVAAYDHEADVVERRRVDWDPLVGRLRVVPTVDELLNERLDAVVVEGRVHDNVALARRAIESGRPVLLEKPAGDRLEPFVELSELAQRQNLHLQLIYLFRYMAAIRELFARARRGDFGTLYEFRGRLPKPLDDYARHEEELGIYPGGIFFEMAGHLIDFATALLGPARRVASFLAHHHTTPGAFIDHGAALLEFERGLGIIEVPALERTPDCRRIELYGTEGACLIPHLGSGHLANDAVQPLDVYTTAAGRWERIEPRAATLQIADLREFAAVVAGRKEPEFSPEHDRVVQRTLLEASGMLNASTPRN